MTTIAIGLYDHFTALDAIGPYQVLSNIPGTTTIICASEPGVIPDDNSLMNFSVEHSFDDVPRPDVLVVPGGFITRQLAADGHPIIDWIASAHEFTTWTTSVCTGSLLLGAAGLLTGLDATTHWAAYDHLAGYGATPTEERVVQRGKIITAAGVSAGIDMALTLAAELAGPDVAEGIQLGLEYDPQPPFDAGSPAKARPEILEMMRNFSAAAGS